MKYEIDEHTTPGNILDAIATYIDEEDTETLYPVEDLQVIDFPEEQLLQDKATDLRITEVDIPEEKPPKDQPPTYKNDEVSIYIRYGYVYKQYHYSEKKAREKFKRLRSLAKKTGDFEWNGWTVRVINPLFYNPPDRTLVLPVVEGVELGSIRCHRTAMGIERALSKWLVYLAKKEYRYNNADDNNEYDITETVGTEENEHLEHSGIIANSEPEHIPMYSDLDNSNILVNEKFHTITLIDVAEKDDVEDKVCFDIATRIFFHTRTFYREFDEPYYLTQALLSEELLDCSSISWRTITRQLPRVLFHQYKIQIQDGRWISALGDTYCMMAALINLTLIRFRRRLYS